MGNRHLSVLGDSLPGPLRQGLLRGTKFLAIGLILNFGTGALGKTPMVQKPSIPHAQNQKAKESNPLEFKDLWIREPAPGQKNAALYGVIHNISDKPVTITGLSISGAARAELHQTQIDSDGISSMKPLAPKILAPDETLSLNPGGNHGMIMEMKKPYQKDQRIPGKIMLENGKLIDFEAQVRP